MVCALFAECIFCSCVFLACVRIRDRARRPAMARAVHSIFAAPARLFRSGALWRYFDVVCQPLTLGAVLDSFIAGNKCQRAGIVASKSISQPLSSSSVREQNPSWPKREKYL